MKHTVRVIVTAGLILLAGFLPLSGQASTGGGWISRQQEKDFYYGLGDRQILVAVALDAIGVVVVPHVEPAQVERLAAANHLSVVRRISGGLFVLALPAPRGRADLVLLARQLKSSASGLLREAGLVVTTQDDPNPRLVSEEIQVLFNADVGRAEIETMLKTLGAEIVRPEAYAKNQYLVRAAAGLPLDALALARRFHDTGRTRFSHPNFWLVADRFETIPNDPLFSNQWHHKNTGAAGGTAGADISTTLAWDLTTGDPSIVIALVDNTFDLTHEDLAANVAPGGRDFIDNTNDPSPVGAGDNHGTAVAGVAVAQFNNNLGVAGACPNCHFLPLSIFKNCDVTDTTCITSTAAESGAINYAAGQGARIISNSWGPKNPATAADPSVVTAIDNATAAGSLVLFAGGNSPSSDYCAAGFPSLPNVIAVSSSSNLDRKVTGHAFGNCIAILAPTRWGSHDPTPTGTLAITTTDRTGADGYNSTDDQCTAFGLTELGNANYTQCFSGTSSATPLTAGVAGLILSANPGLDRVQVQRLIQDTADKIEDSLGAYSDVTGFSSPASGIATHSWGRLNAFEAVRVAAPAPQGRGGVDIFMRDNRLDWGNTGRPSNLLQEPVRGFIPHWESVDIKVDAPPFQPAPTTSAAFDALVDKSPLSGVGNKVYVRVRNRGPVTAATVTVKLHWLYAGLDMPSLPADFWTAFPGDSTDTSQIHPLGTQTLTNLAYSGSSVAGCPERSQPPCQPGDSDAAQIAVFDFHGPPVPTTTPNHFCLLAMADSPQDPISAASRATLVIDDITPNDNNVTHRNLTVEDSGTSSDWSERFYLRNPFAAAATVILHLQAPADWHVRLGAFEPEKAFNLPPHAEVLVTMTVAAPQPGAVGHVTLSQRTSTPQASVTGGTTFYFRPQPAQPPSPGNPSGGTFFAGVFAGGGFPLAAMHGHYSPSFELGAYLERALTPSLRLGFEAAYHAFDFRPGHAATALGVTEVSLTGRWLATSSTVRPFALLGVGGYRALGSWNLGGQAGLGLELPVTTAVSLRAGSAFHLVHAPQPGAGNLEWLGASIGFVFVVP